MNKIDYKQINKDIAKNLNSILNKLPISVTEKDRFYTGICPIHSGSDNETALTIYKDSGNWQCHTRHCEDIFLPSAFGFVRGVLSTESGWKKKGDKICPVDQVVNFIYSYKIDDIPRQSNKDSHWDSLFINQGFVLNKIKISKKRLLESVEIPSNYYIKRGISSTILKKYDIGECKNIKKPFYERAVVPVYDIYHNNIVGCTGRSIHEKCLVCEGYHKPGLKCSQKGKNPKWLHQFNFKAKHHLYNLWFSKDNIQQSREIIIVEGPMDVWKLEEAGIKNSVSIFGTSLSNIQKDLLAKSGAIIIKIVMDNDQAGEDAYNSIFNKLKNIYNIQRISIPTNDVAELSKEQIGELFLCQ
jgi:5S rRNA maturation endonuclease (ribonuclease M5)